MDMITAQALWRLEQLPAERLPDVATRALEEGYDSQALRELAGSYKPTWRDAEATFRRALDELKIPDVSRPEAGLHIANTIAEEIVSGVTDPYHGARKIWVNIWEECGRPSELTAFVDLASAYEDDPEHRQRYAREIIIEAKGLMGEEIK